MSEINNRKFDDGDICELWELRRPDQLPNQKQCYEWYNGKCNTMGCIFNDWDNYEEEEED